MGFTERKRWRIVGPWLFLLIVYLSGLVVLMPLRVVVGLFPLPPDVRLYGANDSAWVGEAESLLIAGRDMGRLEYVVHPWTWLLGRLEYDLVLDDGANRIEMVINRGLWNDALGLGNARGMVDLSLFGQFLPEPLVAGGAMSIALTSGHWLPGEFLRFNGEAQWDNAVFGLVEGVRLGTVDIDLQAAGDGTRIEFDSRRGEVLAAGNLILEADGRFDSQIELRPGEGITPAGRRLLGLVGLVDGGGMLNHAGTLF